MVDQTNHSSVVWEDLSNSVVWMLVVILSPIKSPLDQGLFHPDSQKHLGVNAEYSHLND